MGAALTACSYGLDGRDEASSLSDILSTPGPLLKIRVDAISARESLGMLPSVVRLTEELIVEAMEIMPGWEPLVLRQQRHRREQAGVQAGGSSSSGPFSGSRFSVRQHYFGARVRDWVLLLQVAVSQEQRTMEQVLADMEDAKEVAAWAHNFNSYLQRESGLDGHVPKVRLCAPVACRVLASAVPEIAQKGDVITLTYFPSKDLQKFVYQGNEEFLELPQVFFHYAVWSTGGQSIPYDLQGAESEDGDILLVDPCVLREPKTVFGETGQDNSLAEHFEILHPRCGQICRAFDPNRRGHKVRKMCGLPSCGVR